MKHRSTYEEFISIRNKFYGEPEEIGTEKVNESVKKLSKKQMRRIDELAIKRKKKEENNRAKNEYERQFKVNRKIALVIDNYMCRECGNKEGLHVHHIKERCKGGTNDINNLITLCNDCHKEKHKGETVYNIMNA
jgi:5-methylcytosine-specific restriction endonuclease McrA